MNAEAWERAKSLLAEAADLPAEDRARFRRGIQLACDVEE